MTRGLVPLRLVTTKRMSRPRRVASMRATARRSRPTPGPVRRLGKATNNLAVFHRPLGAHRIRHVLNFGGERPRASQPEEIAEAVLLAEVHDFGTGIVTVAPDGDTCRRPTGPDAAHQPAQMRPHLDAGGRLARPQHDGNRTAGGAVVDMDRQKAALIIMRVEQGELLMP